MPTATTEMAETLEPRRPEGRDGTSVRSIWITFALIIGGIGVVAVLVFGLLGAVILGRGISDSDRTIRELAPVAGAPDAELVMVVTPVGETGFDIDELFSSGEPMATTSGMAVVYGSPVHVSYVETPFDMVAIYSWEEVGTSTDLAMGPTSCVGGTGEYGGFATCSEAGSKVPNISSGSTQDNFGTSFDVFVNGLPADAKWVVVDTESGTRIAAEVVDGIAYVAWPAGEPASDAIAQPQTVRALNAAFEEVWTAPLG